MKNRIQPSKCEVEDVEVREEDLLQIWKSLKN